MVAETKYKADSKGQLELDGIDTPLGQAAEDFVKADAQLKKAQANRQNCETRLADEIKKAKIRTLKYKGDTMQYQPGHVTPEKIKFIPSTN